MRDYSGEKTRYEALSKLFENTPKASDLNAFKAALPLFESVEAPASDAIEAISGELVGLDDELVHTYAVDFTWTFVSQDSTGPFPYESIYTSDGRLLKQASCDDVCHVYSANGFDPRISDSNEPEDYLATMLAFLAFMSEKAQAAAEAGDEAAQKECCEAIDDFKARHLANWLPRFAEEVAGLSETALYRNLPLLALSLAK